MDSIEISSAIIEYKGVIVLLVSSLLLNVVAYYICYKLLRHTIQALDSITTIKKLLEYINDHLNNSAAAKLDRNLDDIIIEMRQIATLIAPEFTENIKNNKAKNITSSKSEDTEDNSNEFSDKYITSIDTMINDLPDDENLG